MTCSQIFQSKLPLSCFFDWLENFKRNGEGTKKERAFLLKKRNGAGTCSSNFAKERGRNAFLKNKKIPMPWVKEFSMPNFSFLSVTKDYHEWFKDFAQRYIRPKNESAQNGLKFKFLREFNPPGFKNVKYVHFGPKFRKFLQ